MINRVLKLPIGENSIFLFGPRQTGKTTLVINALGNHKSVKINLLENETYLRYKASPQQFREEIEFFAKNNEKAIVFIDEIQKVPELLNEIHLLIEKHKNKITFILTGSSARKMRKETSNLLGGRAWTFHLHPFTFQESGESFNLEQTLRFGAMPPIIEKNEKAIIRTLNSYVQTYLKEEISNEALVRNLQAFTRFLDIACDCSGEIVNYSTIGRETGVASKTVKQYYQILEDTLIAFQLDPYLKSMRKRVVMHPKYYFFDIGVINAVCGRLESSPKPKTSLYGQLFEHFIVLELRKLIQYHEKPWKTYFWRTSNGAEVDLVLEIPEGKLYAIEIKSAENVAPKELKGLKQFLASYPEAKALCVCNARHPYEKNDITFLPWRYFFSEVLNL